MKRLFLVWMLCSLILPPARADQPMEYTYTPQTGALTAYTGPGGEVTIPQEVLGQPVYQLGDFLFDQSQTMIAAVVPEGVTHIGVNAFYFNQNLQSVTLPDSLQAVGGYAFFNCTALKELTLPPNLAVIGDNAFASLSALEKLTFTGPAPLHVGESAFTLARDNPNAIITVPADQQAAYEQLLGLPCQPGPQSKPFALTSDAGDLTVDADGTLTAYTGRAAAVVLPDQVNGTPLRAIGPGALAVNRNIWYLEVPEGVEVLGKQSLRATGLMALRLPNSLREIGEDALESTNMLTSLTLGSGLTELGKGAFRQTRLKEITLPAGLTQVPENAFNNSIWLETVILPNTIEAIGPAAFKGCSALSYMVIDRDALPDIAPDALEGTKLADVDIAATATKAQEDAARAALAKLGIQTNVWRANEADQAPYAPGDAFTFDAATGLLTGYTGTQTEVSSFWNMQTDDGLVAVSGIGEGIFRGSAVTRFDLPRSNQFTTIGNEAFADSQLAEIRLFDSLTTIGEGAFRNCKQLTQVIIPDSVTTVGAGAFAGCEGLTSLVFPASAEVAPDAFQGLNPDVLRATASATDEQLARQAAQLNLPWYMGLLRVGEESTLVPMPESYTPNAETDFEFDAATGQITKYVGTSADVVIPRSISGVPVRDIGFTAFSDLTVLSVTQGQQDNLGLRSVVIPETVQEIGDSAFLNCKALERVISYGPITLLGVRAFEQCEKLADVQFINGIRDIAGYAFHMCGALTGVDLGDKVAIIGEGAFQKCGALKQMRIPASVTAIGNGVFIGCDAMETLCFEKPDPALFPEASSPFPMEATNLRIYLPEDTSDDMLKAFQTFTNGALMRMADIVQRGGCPMQTAEASAPEQPIAEAPEVTTPAEPALTDAPATPAAPVAEPAAQTPPAEQPAAPSGGMQDYIDKMLVCSKAEAAGVVLDPAVIGRYDVRFGADGQAVMTIGGAAMPACPWQQQGDTLVVDYFGTSFVFKLTPEGLQLNYYDAMLLTFTPE